MKKSDIVRVMATDWERDTGWEDITAIEEHTPEPIEVAGFFVGWGTNKHGMKFLKIALSVGQEGLSTVYIPKPCLHGKPQVLYGKHRKVVSGTKRFSEGPQT